jgi:hypothetical protein
VTLPRGIADYGDTPRAIGSLYAAGLGFDAVTYLDADNWYHPRHIESLVQLAAQGPAAIVTSRREFRHLETGEFMAECLTSDGEQFCDTNCLLLTRAAFSLLANWALMEPDFHIIDDRVIWHHVLASGLPRTHTGLASLAYRTTHAGIYHDLKRPIPPGAKNVDMQLAIKKWLAQGRPTLQLRWAYLLRRRMLDWPD